MVWTSLHTPVGIASTSDGQVLLLRAHNHVSAVRSATPAEAVHAGALAPGDTAALLGSTWRLRDAIGPLVCELAWGFVKVRWFNSGFS